MTVEIRALSPADAEAVHELDAFAFVLDPTTPGAATATAPLDWSHTFGARTDATGDLLAGMYTWFDVRLTVPDADPAGRARPSTFTSGCGASRRSVPLAGLSWVGVHPDARRRGVLREMIGHHLRDVREQGYAVAGLTASEKGIYGRFGYGISTLGVSYTVPRSPSLPDASTPLGAAAAKVDVRLRFRTDDEETLALLRRIDASGPARPGFLRLPERVDRDDLRDTPAARVGDEPPRALVATRDGEGVGYAIFRRTPRWGDGPDAGKVRVRALHAHDDAALLALVARLADIDLSTGATLNRRSLDDAPLGWLGGPSDLDVSVADALWLRPLDVGAMLAARGYGAECDVVLDVLDPTCPWNEGRWRLATSADGAAECAPTTDPADVRLGAAAIGPWYLGLRDVRAPLLTAVAPAAGGVEELRPGALAALGRAAATPTQPLGGRGF